MIFIPVKRAFNKVFDPIYSTSEIYVKQDQTKALDDALDKMAADYKGDIFPCLRYMESSIGHDMKPLIIGTVYDGIMATAEQRECVDCLQCITRRTQSTDECFHCPIAQGCAYNYQEFGTPDKRATYICEMHKARVLANVYFWNKAYAKRNENKAFANNVPNEWALKIIGEQELTELKKLERV